MVCLTTSEFEIKSFSRNAFSTDDELIIMEDLKTNVVEAIKEMYGVEPQLVKKGLSIRLNVRAREVARFGLESNQFYSVIYNKPQGLPAFT